MVRALTIVASIGVLAAGLFAFLTRQAPPAGGPLAAAFPGPGAPAQEPKSSAPEPKPGIGSWTQFRGDLQNSGVSHSPRPKYKGVKWKYFVGAPTTSTPVVADGLVITASEAGFVNAIDAATGTKTWIHKCGTGELGKGIIFTTPLIFGGRIYVGSRTGTLYCLDLKTGDEVFAFDAGEKEIYASPKGDERGIVFGTIDGIIWCLDPKDGKPKWKVDAHREVGATAAILGNTIYIPGKDRNFYEIDFATGDLRHKPPVQLPGTTHCTPSLGAGYAFLVTGGRKSYAIDIMDGATHGKTVWEDDATGDDHVAVGYADGVAYFHLGMFLRAVDGPTGRKLWEFKADHKVAPPIINGGEILIAGRDQKFRVIDRKTAAEVWSLDLGEGFVAGPVLVDGVVYLAGDVNEGMHIFAIE